MKICKVIILFLILICADKVRAQKELYGKWTAHCLIEYTSKASMQFCDLCPIQKKDNSITINDIDIEIKDSFIFLNNGNRGESFEWSDETKSLSFKFNNKQYVFVVLFGSNPNTVILKAKEGGNIVELEKSK